MIRCKVCHIEMSTDLPTPDSCPSCGANASVKEDSHDSWVLIARLSNLAEAGFFADWLDGEGMEARVREHHEFSAVDGSWQTVYVLEVPAEYGAEAAQRLTSELEAAEESNESASPFDRGARYRGETAAGLWTPVVFLLIFVGFLYFTRAIMRHPRNAVSRDASSFWNALTESQRVFASEGAPGQPGSRLSCDPRSRTISLQEDLDGDGHFERERHFRDGQLVFEASR